MGAGVELAWHAKERGCFIKIRFFTSVTIIIFATLLQ
jgi:hypothetical protein